MQVSGASVVPVPLSDTLPRSLDVVLRSSRSAFHCFPSIVSISASFCSTNMSDPSHWFDVLSIMLSFPV